jgi:hypothetical protein
LYGVSTGVSLNPFLVLLSSAYRPMEEPPSLLKKVPIQGKYESRRPVLSLTPENKV